ncbi:hypothetical protein NLI96_g4345 [Meripilus lineatus]|uniref:Uncharacterized protein n=1 Tax=Meripilus lineatus TaxID=2056292 RepID=A0AAD5YEV3_9APHY|nr:hypothetical protein NLI96_g4345 [Physisporinus lineatus]
MLNEVFLGSCLDVYDKRSTKLVVEEDEDAANRERLSASYPYATYDFYGTPSGALCVYKNGDACPIRTRPESQRIIREAHPVYDHPIQASWRAVGERIYTILDDKKVLWTSVDPLAFAEAGKEIFSPLLLWIGVQPASLVYEDANTAAEAITFFLAEAGFEGIEIGFRESIVTRSTSGPKMLSFNPLCNSLPDLRKPFTPTLGLSIAPLNTPYSEGTGALYFRESKESDRIFLLTCAHVARPRPVHRNSGPSPKSRPPEQVIALGIMGYNDALLSMMSTIGEQSRLIRDWEDVLDRLGKPEKDEDKEITEERKELLGLVEKAKKKIEKTDKFHSEVTQHWTILHERVIGKVVHVEPIAVSIKPQQYTKD